MTDIGDPQIGELQPNEFWAGDFGNQYTVRNRVDWRARVTFWISMMAMARPTNIMEIGCNAGWNLRAIREASPGASTVGIDINAAAIREAKRAGFDAYVKKATDCGDFIADIDLVFTAGVLIHVAPNDLQPTMEKIVDRSERWVLAVEYYAPEPEEITYRGHAGKLWRRPFGELYKAMGLKCAAEGIAQGFDNCAYWLMEKQ